MEPRIEKLIKVIWVESVMKTIHFDQFESRQIVKKIASNSKANMASLNG